MPPDTEYEMEMHKTHVVEGTKTKKSKTVGAFRIFLNFLQKPSKKKPTHQSQNTPENHVTTNCQDSAKSDDVPTRSRLTPWSSSASDSSAESSSSKTRRLNDIEDVAPEPVDEMNDDENDNADDDVFLDGSYFEDDYTEDYSGSSNSDYNNNIYRCCDLPPLVIDDASDDLFDRLGSNNLDIGRTIDKFQDKVIPECSSLDEFSRLSEIPRRHRRYSMPFDLPKTNLIDSNGFTTYETKKCGLSVRTKSVSDTKIEVQDIPEQNNESLNIVKSYDDPVTPTSNPAFGYNSTVPHVNATELIIPPAKEIPRKKTDLENNADNAALPDLLDRFSSQTKIQASPFQNNLDTRLNDKPKQMKISNSLMEKITPHSFEIQPSIIVQSKEKADPNRHHSSDGSSESGYVTSRASSSSTPLSPVLTKHDTPLPDNNTDTSSKGDNQLKLTEFGSTPPKGNRVTPLHKLLTGKSISPYSRNTIDGINKSRTRRRSGRPKPLVPQSKTANVSSDLNLKSVPEFNESLSANDENIKIEPQYQNRYTKSIKIDSKKSSNAKREETVVPGLMSTSLIDKSIVKINSDLIDISLNISVSIVDMNNSIHSGTWKENQSLNGSLSCFPPSPQDNPTMTTVPPNNPTTTVPPTNPTLSIVPPNNPILTILPPHNTTTILPPHNSTTLLPPQSQTLTIGQPQTPQLDSQTPLCRVKTMADYLNEMVVTSPFGKTLRPLCTSSPLPNKFATKSRPPTTGDTTPNRRAMFDSSTFVPVQVHCSKSLSPSFCFHKTLQKAGEKRKAKEKVQRLNSDRRKRLVKRKSARARLNFDGKDFENELNDSDVKTRANSTIPTFQHSMSGDYLLLKRVAESIVRQCPHQDLIHNWVDLPALMENVNSEFGKIMESEGFKSKKVHSISHLKEKINKSRDILSSLTIENCLESVLLSLLVPDLERTSASLDFVFEHLPRVVQKHSNLSHLAPEVVMLLLCNRRTIVKNNHGFPLPYFQSEKEVFKAVVKYVESLQRKNRGKSSVMIRVKNLLSIVADAKVLTTGSNTSAAKRLLKESQACDSGSQHQYDTKTSQGFFRKPPPPRSVHQMFFSRSVPPFSLTKQEYFFQPFISSNINSLDELGIRKSIDDENDLAVSLAAISNESYVLRKLYFSYRRCNATDVPYITKIGMQYWHKGTKKTMFITKSGHRDFPIQWSGARRESCIHICKDVKSNTSISNVSNNGGWTKAFDGNVTAAEEGTTHHSMQDVGVKKAAVILKTGEHITGISVLGQRALHNIEIVTNTGRRIRVHSIQVVPQDARWVAISTPNGNAPTCLHALFGDLHHSPSGRSYIQDIGALWISTTLGGMNDLG